MRGRYDRLLPPVAILLILLAGCVQARPERPEGGWKLVVLGVAQDGGMPHAGCARPPCSEVRAGKRRPERVSCLGLVNREFGAAWLFDATPDFPAQLHALTGGRPPAGIFLTHGHIGHYTGLMYLGKEAMAAREVPVYATARMEEFLERNGPWSLLVSDQHLAIRRLTPDQAVELPGGVKVTPMTVPHRDEFTDTLGFLIEGPRRKALFIPDIDRWEKWERPLARVAAGADYAFLDGTFGSLDELPQRDLSKVRHPLMSETRELMKGSPAQLFFIHLNHSNPELTGQRRDVAREGMELPM